MRAILIAVFLFAAMSAPAQLSTSTTLAQQTANNTSASNTFAGQSNGNAAAGNVSKLPIRSLLYPGSTTRIFAHVEPWWGSSSHVNIGYNSQDPAQVHRQVQDMVSRGIDGAVIDWYGPGSYEDPGVKLYVSEAEATPNFTIVIEIDVGGIKWHSCYPTCSATTAAINLFTTASTNFFSSPAIERWNGRPVAMEFAFSTLTLPSGAPSGWNVVDWNAVEAQVPGNVAFLHRNFNGYSVAQSAGAFVWMEPESLSNFTAGFDDTVDLDWFYSNSVKSYPAKLPFGALWKGFDDTIASWSPPGGRHIDQNCGQTWLNTFAKINQYYSSTRQLAALQLVTWNDYEEGTEIETGIDNCVSLSPALSGSQLSWTTAGNENAVDHYTVYASPDGSALASIGDFSTSTHSLDLSSFSLPAGTYSMYVQAVGKPTIVNHISPAVTYTVTAVQPKPSPKPVQRNVTVSANPSSQTVTSGQTAAYTLTVAQTGSTDPVQLSCTGSGVSCTFSSSTVNASSSGTQVQMTVSTTSQSARNLGDSPVLAALFGGIGLFGLTLRRRRVAALLLLACALALQIACGGVGMTTTTASKPPTVATTSTPTTYSITVNAVSGSVSKSTIVSLTVK